MLQTRCHCGAVSIVVPRRPRVLTACNCSMCRRIQPLFAYYVTRSIDIGGKADAQESYMWGKRVLRWFRCRSCGCFTHHEPNHPATKGTARTGVNLALAVDPGQLVGIPINLRDGAASNWKVIDSFRFGDRHEGRPPG